MKKQQHREKEQTVSFRMTREDLRRQNAKVIVSGLPRTEYLTRLALREGIHIFVGRFESDRLGVERTLSIGCVHSSMKFIFL